MYVADMTLSDAQMFLRDYKADKAQRLRNGWHVDEQLLWDIEDLEGRIEDLLQAHDACDW